MFYSFLSYGLQDALYILQAVDSLQIIHDHLYIFAIVNSDFDATVEDAVVAADGELVYVDIELVADDTAHVEEQSLAVDALYLDGGVKVHQLVHLPLGVDDAVAIARLELGCHRAGALVYLDTVLVVDVAHDVIARNGMAA